jgi:hypothetical protein
VIVTVPAAVAAVWLVSPVHATDTVPPGTFVYVVQVD